MCWLWLVASQHRNAMFGALFSCLGASKCCLRTFAPSLGMKKCDSPLTFLYNNHSEIDWRDLILLHFYKEIWRTELRYLQFLWRNMTDGVALPPISTKKYDRRSYATSISLREMWLTEKNPHPFPSRKSTHCRVTNLISLKKCNYRKPFHIDFFQRNRHSYLLYIVCSIICLSNQLGICLLHNVYNLCYPR